MTALCLVPIVGALLVILGGILLYYVVPLMDRKNWYVAPQASRMAQLITASGLFLIILYSLAETTRFLIGK